MSGCEQPLMTLTTVLPGTVAVLVTVTKVVAVVGTVMVSVTSTVAVAAAENTVARVDVTVTVVTGVARVVTPAVAPTQLQAYRYEAVLALQAVLA